MFLIIKITYEKYGNQQTIYVLYVPSCALFIIYVVKATANSWVSFPVLFLF